MLRIQRIEISNFVCFDQIVIEPSKNRSKPLTVIRAENGSGKTTLLRAIRWGMYGEDGLPGTARNFSLHPAHWTPDEKGIETRVSILFETDGAVRDAPRENEKLDVYELRRSITTIGADAVSPDGPDFRRRDENTQLHMRQPDGSWEPLRAGIKSVIEQLLPFELRDFFVMDADEATDFVGGSENKIIDRRSVISKTSYAVEALLGLDVFKAAAKRLDKISDDFGRKATKIVDNDELSAMQTQLDKLRSERDQQDENLKSEENSRIENSDSLQKAQDQFESLIGIHHATEQFKDSREKNKLRSKKENERRKNTADKLSAEIGAIDILASLSANEICNVCKVLQPLYDDGSIPVSHLPFVQSLLEGGCCVCGNDLTGNSDYRRQVQLVIEKSSGRQESAKYLAQVLNAAQMLYRYQSPKEWNNRVDRLSAELAEIDSELSELNQEIRDLNNQIQKVDSSEFQKVQAEISMLKEQDKRINMSIGSIESKRQNIQQRINQLDGNLRVQQKHKREADSLVTKQAIADSIVKILNVAYDRIRREQVQELSNEMNSLFSKMAANVKDDHTVEQDRSKATIQMIAQVGVQPLDRSQDTFEIFAKNSRGRSMPPTEINGASRRILALSFVLGLSRVSKTEAPLIADSLLNFMSGSVRTNTLRVTSEITSQPIFLLTGSDLESEIDADLVENYAGATYTLTGQWQHVSQGGDVVNLTSSKPISLVCSCGPREFCHTCERIGQAEKTRWTNKSKKGIQ